MRLFSRSEGLTKCKRCGTVFDDSERLKRHNSKAHKKILEKCRSCGVEFHTYEDLRKHKKKCK